MKCFCLLFIFCLLSCSNKQDKEGLIVNCQHEILFDDDEYILGKPTCMALVDSVLAISDLQTNPMLHLFNVKTGEQIGQYLSRGVGPNEFMRIGTLERLNGDTLFFHDLNKRTCYFLVLPNKEYEDVQIIEAFRCSKVAHNTLIPLKNNSYVASGIYPKGRFCLLTDSGTTEQYWGIYPFRDDMEKSFSNIVKTQAYMGQLSSSPTKDKFVFCAYAAKIFSFYKYINGNIQLIKEIQNSLPDYVYGENMGMYMGTSKNTPITYLDVCATNQFVYLLYSGKTVGGDGLNAFESNVVQVYDWRGEWVKTLCLSVNIKELTVSEDDKMMYAIADLPNPIIVRFGL